MKKFGSKRLTLVVLSFAVLTIMGLWALGKDMEAVAVTVATALAGIVGWYTKKESDAQSKNSR